MYTLYHGDCLIEMDKIPDNSVDLILADLPYGTTSCKWDSVIPLNPLWEQYKRIIRKNRAIVLTSGQPFTSVLVCSNLGMFKYEWIWEKNQGSNFASVKYQPMKEHESVLVFSEGTHLYNPQMIERSASGKSRASYGYKAYPDKKQRQIYTGVSKSHESHPDPNKRVPRSIIKFNKEFGLHPTQKPVDLMEYLIRTYTEEGDIVLDNTMGSGTTIVAANNTKRSSIGIELYPLPDKPIDKNTNPNYFFEAQERIERELNKPRQEELK